LTASTAALSPAIGAVVVPVGADQVGQHLGVAGIGFRAGDLMAVAVAGHGERVDRIHLVPGRAQGLHPQAAIGFDADHHLAGFCDMGGHQLVEPANARESFGQPPRRQARPVSVHHVNVVVVFSPIVSNKDHPRLLTLLWCNLFRARDHPAGTSWISAQPARHPISAIGDLTNRPGHDLHLEIDKRPRFSVCSPAGGSVISLPRSKPNPVRNTLIDSH
jgi:hypothetical protein